MHNSVAVNSVVICNGVNGTGVDLDGKPANSLTIGTVKNITNYDKEVIIEKIIDITFDPRENPTIRDTNQTVRFPIKTVTLVDKRYPEYGIYRQAYPR